MEQLSTILKDKYKNSKQTDTNMLRKALAGG